MGAQRRRPQDGFRLRLSTSNLPGTLFLLILIVCATVLMLSKGLNSLKEAYAETNQAIPNALIVQQNSGQSSQVPSPLRAAEGSEQSAEELAKSQIKPDINDVSPSTEHSSDYVLIPSGSKEPETQTVVN
jgi:hypothetical protein